jgi:steroid 5-alpha reductase family enzyme
MVLYGVRIFLFSWFRMSSSSYAPRFENVRKADAQMPSPVKFALWLQCTFLYGFHLFAVYLAGQAGEVNASVLFGTIIILAGTVIEGLADQQKQRSKAVAPDDFVQTWLFARWRHPNYMGEILVQVGLIVAGFGVAGIGWSGYMAVVLAPLYIILLMVAEAGRADGYMELRYGERPEFADYRTRSGSLLPRF